MGLQELEEKLHRPDAESRGVDIDKYNPSSVESRTPLSTTSKWNVKRESPFIEHAKSIKWGLAVIGGIAFVSVVAATFVIIRNSLFSSDRVLLTVSGPENVNSSDITEFHIAYKNENRTKLRNAEIIVSYPQSFRPEGNSNSFRNDASSSTISIGDIPSFGSGSVSFSGKFYGSRNSVAYLRSVLRYKPSNLEAEFSSETQKSVNLRTSSLAVELDAPLTVSPQGEVNYLVNYENAGDAELSNVRMKAMYPPGFSFWESVPRPAEGDAVWYLGSIAPGAKGSIRITGSLAGVPNESKLFHVDLGTFQGDNVFLAYSASERSTRLVAPPFSITQAINGSEPSSINPGDDVRCEVSFRNNSGIGLREVIVSIGLDGEAFDYSRLRSGKGAYDSRRKAIIWKASDVPSLANLAPNAEGRVEFTIPIRGDIVPNSPASKNFNVKTIARVESPDVQNPVGSNKIVATNTAVIRVNSRVFLDSLAFYNDNQIQNSGPLPPVVGQETTYTLRWLLSNTTNDITGTEVSADLPTGVRWTGNIFPNSETISYNERTNRVIWNVGSMKVGEGILSPKREVRFQVLVRPEVNQIGNELPLLGISSIRSRDTFTGDSLADTAREKTTNLRDDPSVSSDKYRVAQ